MKTAYICSPYKGDVENNIRKAREWCRKAHHDGYIPVAPHLYFPQFLDESNEKERIMGLSLGLDLLKDCDVVIVCGPTISSGMQAEIAAARKLGKPVKRWDSEGTRAIQSYNGERANNFCPNCGARME